MSDDDNTLESIKANPQKTDRGQSKLVSPNPKRMKYITELMHAFASRKISFAELARLDKKKLRQVSEMGFVKLRHGRYEEAKKIFQVLTFIDHKNYFHHLSLGSAYQKLKKYADAIFQYNQALKYDPKNLNAYVNRGEVYLRMKKYKHAAEDFRQAILIDPTGKNRFSNRARSLVIAIKRCLQRDKDAPEPTKTIEKKKVSPLSLIKPIKKK